MKILRTKAKPPIQIKTTEVAQLRKFLLSKQNERCPICGDIILDAVLDHSHKKRIKGSGLVRGVLCRMCNIFLAKCENNCTRFGIGQKNLPRVLRAIAIYLEQPDLPYIHPSERAKKLKLQRASYKRLFKAYTGKAKFPDYPKTGILTVKLKALFEEYGIEPEYYK